MTPSTRSSNTTTTISSPFPLLQLSPELLDLILFFLAPRLTRQNTLQLTHLLSLHSSLSPLVRRRLFNRITFVLGDKKKRDYRFLDLIEWSPSQTGPETAGEASPVGQHVRRLLIRAPDAMELEGADIDPGLPLAAALVPTTKTPQVEAIELVCRLLDKTRGVLRLEIETRLGMREEDQVVFEEVEEEEEKRRGILGKMLEGLKGMKEFGIAVSHLHHKMQLLATPTWISPFITSFQSWHHLTALDLWRTHFHLPPSYHHPSQHPTFSLRILNLVQCQFGSGKDLEWLLGQAGGKRASKLEVLKYKDIDFVEEGDKGSSKAIFKIFPVEGGTIPSFSSTLRKLELTLYSPLGGFDGEDEWGEGALSTLTALKEVELSGQGISTALFQSLADSPSSHTTLTHLDLWYLPSIPLSTIISLLSLTTTGTGKKSFEALMALDIQLFRGLRRTEPWSGMTGAREPEGEQEWLITLNEWRELRKLSRSRSTISSSKPFVLMENSRIVDLVEESGSEVSESEESEEEEDMDALFEPSSEPEGNEWLLSGDRRLGRESESEDDDDSDFGGR